MDQAFENNAAGESLRRRSDGFCWDDFQAAMMANSLTVQASDDKDSISRYVATGEKQYKIEVASRILERLELQSERLRNQLQIRNDREQYLLRALAEGDRDELARLGIDMSYVWLDDILMPLISGGPFVEIKVGSAFSPNHISANGDLDISFDKLQNSEKTAIILCAALRDIFKNCRNLRFITIINDLDNYLTDKELAVEESNRYIVEISKIMYQAGALLPEDLPGRDYLLLRKSVQSANVDQLIDQLRASTRGVVEIDDHDEVIFRPTPSFVRRLAFGSVSREREFIRNGILLKRRGKPTGHTLDAAGFLNPINRHIIHFLIQDKQREAHQDKLYALLRAIDIVTQDTYHDTFYDSENLSPEIVTYTTCEILADELRKILRIKDLYDHWENFDPMEYVQRNYPSDVLPEDRGMIEFAVEQMPKLGLDERSAKNAIDVGTGPNLYPSMLLAPYIEDDGNLYLLEYAAQSREYLKTSLDQLAHQPEESQWLAFERLMVKFGGEQYSGTANKVQKIAKVIEGSIFALPRDAYDIVTSFFVAESITTSRREFRIAIRSLANSLGKGGVLIVAHMVGSLGYHAGKGTRFPSVWLSLAEIEEAYHAVDLEFSIRLVEELGDSKARERYQGMAIVIAKRSDEIPKSSLRLSDVTS